MIIDGAFLKLVAPKFRGSKSIAQLKIIEALDAEFHKIIFSYAINSRLRIAHFLAQILHESAGLRTTEEFASGSAYEGRISLGNTKPGDGRRFKGRGLLQLTGRANYQSMGQQLGIDLIKDPARAAEPELSLTIACTYWAQRHINPHADRDDLEAVTKLVNGGLNGLADRRGHLIKVKRELDRIGGKFIQPVQQIQTTSYLRKGAKGDAVTSLQGKLNRLGFSLAVDGDFGSATEQAVISLQKNRGSLPMAS